MGTNLECEVDVEAAADMIDYGEERKVGDGSISRRRSLRPRTAHEARGNRPMNAHACGHSHWHVVRYQIFS
jgi:hypothetical protein